jgi:hypothetical protein
VRSRRRPRSPRNSLRSVRLSRCLSRLAGVLAGTRSDSWCLVERSVLVSVAVRSRSFSPSSSALHPRRSASGFCTSTSVPNVAFVHCTRGSTDPDRPAARLLNGGRFAAGVRRPRPRTFTPIIKCSMRSVQRFRSPALRTLWDRRGANTALDAPPFTRCKLGSNLLEGRAPAGSVPGRGIGDDRGAVERWTKHGRVCNLAAQPAAHAGIDHLGHRLAPQRVGVGRERQRRASRQPNAGVVAGAGVGIDAEALTIRDGSISPGENRPVMSVNLC